MSFYARRILPRLIAAGMRNPVMRQHRPRIPGQAQGTVLEVGIGSGLNLPFYGPAVRRLYGLEPSEMLREQAAEAAATAAFPVELLAAGAEQIPLASGTVDTVVSTWTLCSIPDLPAALAELRRVLKSDGTLLFLEHGLAPDPAVARWQHRLAPALRLLAGCNPDRPLDRDIERAGFRLAEIERGYFDGPRFLSWHFVGRATPL